MNTVWAGGHRADSERAVPLHPRSAVAIALASAVGLLGLGWPLLIPAGSALAGGAGSWLFAALVPLTLAVVLAEISEHGFDARAIALLGVLAAVGAALRPLGAGVAGIEPVFALLLPAGRVLGRGFGFVLGALTLLASALLTGGVGPWLPFQMLGAAWIGLGAGCLPRARGRAEVVLLAGYGLVAGLGFGLVMNLTLWPYLAGPATGAGGFGYLPGASWQTNVVAFLRFSVLTSLGWDLVRGATLAVLTLLGGRAVLVALRRTARRAVFGHRRPSAAIGQRAGRRTISRPGPRRRPVRRRSRRRDTPPDR